MEEANLPCLANRPTLLKKRKPALLLDQMVHGAVVVGDSLSDWPLRYFWGVMRGCEPSNDGSLVAEVVVGDLAQDPQDRTDGNQKKDQATSAAI